MRECDQKREVPPEHACFLWGKVQCCSRAPQVRESELLERRPSTQRVTTEFVAKVFNEAVQAPWAQRRLHTAALSFASSCSDLSAPCGAVSSC